MSTNEDHPVASGLSESQCEEAGLSVLDLSKMAVEILEEDKVDPMGLLFLVVSAYGTGMRDGARLELGGPAQLLSPTLASVLKQCDDAAQLWTVLGRRITRAVAKKHGLRLVGGAT